MVATGSSPLNYFHYNTPDGKKRYFSPSPLLRGQNFSV